VGCVGGRQCEDYLNALGVTKEAMSDTAGSAMHIMKEGLTEVAAVCSARAAELYGLDVHALPPPSLPLSPPLCLHP
jgi:prephenate dehydratase